MAQFAVNAQRFDLYKGFKFRMRWDGHYVKRISRLGALEHSTEIVQRRENVDPATSRTSPGCTKYEALTLGHGVTHDKEFEQ